MLITIPEVCERLAITKHACYRLIHSGMMPAIRVSHGRNRYLVDEDVVGKIGEDEDFYAVPVIEAPAPPTVLLTASEVAVRLRCAVETVRRLAGNGTLPAVRNPGRNSHWRFRESDIETYVSMSNTDQD